MHRLGCTDIQKHSLASPAQEVGSGQSKINYRVTCNMSLLLFMASYCWLVQFERDLIWFCSISNSIKRRCIILCFSRQSFCKSCKIFLWEASFYDCKFKPAELCEKRVVYSKLFELCNDCKNLQGTLKREVPFVLRVWTQKGPNYKNGFHYNYIPSHQNIAVVYNGFHVIILQESNLNFITIV